MIAGLIDIPPEDKQRIVESAESKVRVLFEHLYDDEEYPRDLYSILDSLEWLEASDEHARAKTLSEEFAPILIDYVEFLIEKSVNSGNTDGRARDGILQGIHWLAQNGRKKESVDFNKHYADLLAKKIKPPESVIKNG